MLAEGIAQFDTLTIGNGQTVGGAVPTIRYQYRDHLGSSTIEANELGQVISYEEYYSYGVSAYRAAASGVDLSLKRYRFTGKERDEETGLDYFGVRYYAPWLGRWTSGDPGGFVDGLNLYRYTKNNPVNGVDPQGYCICPPDCPDCPNTTPPTDNTRVVKSDQPPVDYFGDGMTKLEMYRTANEMVINGVDLPEHVTSEFRDTYGNTINLYSSIRK